MSSFASIIASTILIVYTSLESTGQNTVQSMATDTAAKIEQIIIYSDPGIDNMLDLWVDINDSLKGMTGYRVQLFFGSGAGSKTKAREIKAQFIQKYRDVPSYLKYVQPNFTVRAGNFRDRLSAQEFLDEVKQKFPSSYIVKDIIELPVIGN